MARGRPATPLGTWGEINVRELPAGNYQAETWLRLWSGDSVRLQARGPSKSAAVNRLKAKCTERLGATDTDVLATTSPVHELLEHWMTTKKKLRPQSRDRYQKSIDLHIVPAFGNMRINEVTPSFLNQWLHSQPVGVARTIRTVLKGAFQMATRYGLMPADPMSVVEPVNAEPKEVRALEVGELQPFRDHIGTAGNDTLSDVVDFCMATGLRAGEVLALRWEDVDLEHKPPLMFVTGTLAYSKATGHIRQDFGKTEAGGRVIQLPVVAVNIIRRRLEQYADLPMVFPFGAAPTSGRTISTDGYAKPAAKNSGSGSPSTVCGRPSAPSSPMSSARIRLRTSSATRTAASRSGSTTCATVRECPPEMWLTGFSKSPKSLQIIRAKRQKTGDK